MKIIFRSACLWPDARLSHDCDSLVKDAYGVVVVIGQRSHLIPWSNVSEIISDVVPAEEPKQNKAKVKRTRTKESNAR